MKKIGVREKNLFTGLVSSLLSLFFLAVRSKNKTGYKPLSKKIGMVLLFISLPFPAMAREPKTAVVVIDMQHVYVNHVPPRERELLILQQMEVIKWANKNRHPILLFEMYKTGRTVEPLRQEIGKNPYFIGA